MMKCKMTRWWFTCLLTSTLYSSQPGSPLLGSQLRDLNKSASEHVTSQNPGVDIAEWGNLQEKFPYRQASTKEEFFEMTYNFGVLKKLYAEKKQLAAQKQNNVIEIEVNYGSLLTYRQKLSSSVKNILTSALLVLGTASILKQVPEQKELLKLKAGIAGSGLFSSLYMCYKTIQLWQDPDINTLDQQKNDLERLKIELTTTKFYLKDFEITLTKHTRFHSINPTPYGSDDFTGMLSSSTLSTSTPLPDK